MNISVIIPIHEYNDQISSYLNKSIESILKQDGISDLPKIYVVYAAAIEEGIKSFKESLLRHYQDSINIDFVKNDDNTSYQAQVNFAVKTIDCDYFSVLEFDDEYSISYFKNVEKYIKAYPDVDIFLPMMVEVNEKDEGIKLTNETVWAQQFVGENGEMGYLNSNSLKLYTDFKLSGAIIKKSEFISVGGYKSNIKLAFMYEFLLRAINNTCKIFTIPKIGYKHLATREGSLFNIYKNTLSIEERKFWFETATNEANFMNDRPIDLTRLTRRTTA
jgi:Glycosyl transferase family 2